jgi:uncharacterized protein YigA (DUF484 family)
MKETSEDILVMLIAVKELEIKTLKERIQHLEKRCAENDAEFNQLMQAYTVLLSEIEKLRAVKKKKKEKHIGFNHKDNQ